MDFDKQPNRKHKSTVKEEIKHPPVKDCNRQWIKQMTGKDSINIRESKELQLLIDVFNGEKFVSGGLDKLRQNCTKARYTLAMEDVKAPTQDLVHEGRVCRTNWYFASNHETLAQLFSWWPTCC